MEIIPATPAHYQGIAETYNSLRSLWTQVSALEIAEGEARRDPKFKFQRWVALEKDQVVGMGYHNQSHWFAHPQKFTLWIGVRPEYQSRGIGSALYETIMRGLEVFDPIALRVMAIEELPQSVQFLKKRGFQEVIRDICNHQQKPEQME